MQINTDTVTLLFRSHFEELSNDRILFSGKFGSGKTYFLEKFFENTKDTTFRLSPVNYSVSSNENIFEYIKFDLIFLLLKSFDLISTGKAKFNDKQLLQQFLIYNTEEAVKELLKFLSKVDEQAKLIDEVWSGITSMNQTFKDFKNKHKNKSDHEEVINFVTNNSQQKGSIYEDDLITQIIRLGINHLKKIKTSKITLIVDDLDRLDPEHIFRILNVFSVHNNDYYLATNKFDFDKIILVCDINNIEEIFKHRYGPTVDFEGYIDKFYTNDVFKFDNSSSLTFFCETYISPLINDENTSVLLKYILESVVNYEFITVRNIIKSKIFIEKSSNLVEDFEIVEGSYDPNKFFPARTYQYGNYPYEILSFENESSFYISSDDLPILKMIKILAIMFGDFHRLKYYIGKLINDEDKRILPTKDSLMIIQSICLIDIISQNYEYPISIFYKVENQHGFNVLNRISCNLFGANVIVNLSWNHNNKYRGTESYFKDSAFQISLQSSLEKTLVPRTSLYRKMLHILNFVDRNNLHHMLGLTGRHKLIEIKSKN